MYFLSTDGRIRQREKDGGGGRGQERGGRGEREEGEVNNESVPNSFSDQGGVGLGEASGALVCLLAP